MTPIKKINALVALFSASGCFYSAIAQDPNGAIEKALESRYALTQPNGDNTDIVTPGAVLVLEKNSVLLAATTSATIYQNEFKGGKVSPIGLGKLDKWRKAVPGQSAGGPATHTYVRGEKMWVTKIYVKEDGVYFDLFTDAIENVRFRGSVKFPFPKNQPPTPEQAEKTVGELFSVQGEDQVTANQQPAQPSAPAPAPVVAPPPPVAAPPPIAPPPPPPDQPVPAPPTIALRQTKQEVEANFGKPIRVANMGTKQIYFYKDMKVTFTNGRVSDIQ